MTGPDRIWAWEVNYPIHKDHGSKRWFPWRPKPMTLEMYEGWFTLKKVEIPQVFTEYIRRDPAVLAALPEVQALIRQAVEAEREALQQARDTNRRFQRRMQLLEGWWQRRVERADKWRMVWQRIYCTDVLDVRALSEADYQRGYEDGLHDRVKIPTQRRAAAIRKRGEG